MPTTDDHPTPVNPGFPSTIPGPSGRLEIAVELSSARRETSNRSWVGLLAHPHPLYGGSMDNAVVCRTARRLRGRGGDTVRFNFRGVGNSEGEHDGGDGEVADLVAAFDWCRARFEGARVMLIGYSFGAATILRSAPLVGTEGVLLIAPPLSFHDVSRAPMTAAFRSQPPDHTRAELRPALLYGSEDELTANSHRAQTQTWEIALEEELPGVAHDLGATGSAEQQERFDLAIDRCLQALADQALR